MFVSVCYLFLFFTLYWNKIIIIFIIIHDCLSLLLKRAITLTDVSHQINKKKKQHVMRSFKIILESITFLFFYNRLAIYTEGKKFHHVSSYPRVHHNSSYGRFSYVQFEEKIPTFVHETYLYILYVCVCVRVPIHLYTLRVIYPVDVYVNIIIYISEQKNNQKIFSK